MSTFETIYQTLFSNVERVRIVAFGERSEDPVFSPMLKHIESYCLSPSIFPDSAEKSANKLQLAAQVVNQHFPNHPLLVWTYTDVFRSVFTPRDYLSMTGVLPKRWEHYEYQPVFVRAELMDPLHQELLNELKRRLPQTKNSLLAPVFRANASIFPVMTGQRLVIAHFGSDT
jgi:hypothetical protein